MSILQKTNIAVDIANGEQAIEYMTSAQAYIQGVFSKSNEGKGRDRLESCLKSLKMALGNYEYLWGSLIRSEVEKEKLMMEVASLNASLIIEKKKAQRANEKFEKLKDNI